MQEQAKYWHVNELGSQVPMLRASFITHVFPRHTHDSYAIGFVEEGAERYYYRGEMHFAAAGHVMLLNPDEVHTGQSAAPDGWRYRMLYPDPELVRCAASQIAGHAVSQPYFPRTVVDDPVVFSSLRYLHLTLESSPATLAREIHLLWALAELIMRHAEVRPTPADIPTEPYAISVAREYIHAHYNCNISLERLAQLTSFSPFHFSRMFRKVVGLPPHAYLNQVRVTRAREMLARAVPIVEVADATGFVDQSHLTRAFKALVGVTPGQFSKNLQESPRRIA
jgi:AraC-like DNA-binding protein